MLTANSLCKIYMTYATGAHSVVLQDQPNMGPPALLSMRLAEQSLPMLASACPGWVCYAEKTHGSYILPYISTAKSPQVSLVVCFHFGVDVRAACQNVQHKQAAACMRVFYVTSHPLADSPPPHTDILITMVMVALHDPGCGCHVHSNTHTCQPAGASG